MPGSPVDPDLQKFSLRANCSTNKNLEILLSVNVIDGQPGPPHIVSAVAW
jgi:hypothetical protein